MNNKDSGLLKREDVPFEVTMALTQALREIDPDKKLIFAGDDNPLDEKSRAEMEEFEELFKHACVKSISTGTCWGCGAKVPGFDEWVESQLSEDKAPEIQEGWGIVDIGHGDDQMHAFECGSCVGPSLGDRRFGLLQVTVDEHGEATTQFLKTPEGSDDSQQST